MALTSTLSLKGTLAQSAEPLRADLDQLAGVHGVGTGVSWTDSKTAQILLAIQWGGVTGDKPTTHYFPLTVTLGIAPTADESVDEFVPRLRVQGAAMTFEDPTFVAKGQGLVFELKRDTSLAIDWQGTLYFGGIRINETSAPLFINLGLDALGMRYQQLAAAGMRNGAGTDDQWRFELFRTILEAGFEVELADTSKLRWTTIGASGSLAFGLVAEYEIYSRLEFELRQGLEFYAEYVFRGLHAWEHSPLPEEGLVETFAQDRGTAGFGLIYRF